MKIIDPYAVQNLQPKTPQQMRVIKRNLRILGISLVGFATFAFLALGKDDAPHKLQWLASIIGNENAYKVLWMFLLLMGVFIFLCSFLKAKYPTPLKKMR